MFLITAFCYYRHMNWAYGQQQRKKSVALLKILLYVRV